MFELESSHSTSQGGCSYVGLLFLTLPNGQPFPRLFVALARAEQATQLCSHAAKPSRSVQRAPSSGVKSLQHLVKHIDIISFQTLEGALIVLSEKTYNQPCTSSPNVHQGINLEPSYLISACSIYISCLTEAFLNIPVWSGCNQRRNFYTPQ